MTRPNSMHLFVPDSVESVRCPECGVTTSADEWTESVVGCEVCGEHSAIRCPKCGEDFEHVWGSSRFKDQQGKATGTQS